MPGQCPTIPHPPVGNLRVGMIFQTDPDNPTQLSGMPHAMAAALREQGVDIVPLMAVDLPPQRPGLGTRIVNRARSEGRNATPRCLVRWHGSFFSDRIRQTTLDRANAMSDRVRSQLDRHELDLLFGVCISTALFSLETTLPIVYFSDATSPLLHTTYPRLAEQPEIIRKTLTHIERVALARVARAAFASPQTRDSAVNDLGVPPHRAGVIPMGAHITPADPSGVRVPAEPPTARDCRLLIVAADPVRKRVDLALRATELLRARGIRATLSVIGPGTRRSRRNGSVESAGPLRIANPACAQRHRELLRSCHLQLLPSLGEAYGIAPAESAHFARPSIVSDAGGLPSVVLDDQTGLVLPVSADHHAWAHAIEGLIRDPERYRRYSAAALTRARTELNWSAWAARTVGLMREVVPEARTPAATPTRRTG